MGSNINGPIGFLGSSEWLGILLFIAWCLIHVIFAVAVYTDGKENGTKLVWPSLWGIVTLFGGPMMAAAYWVVCRIKLEAVEKDKDLMKATEGSMKTTEDKIAEYREKLLKRRERSKPDRYI